MMGDAEIVMPPSKVKFILGGIVVKYMINGI